MIFVNELVVLGKNLPIYEVCENNFPPWRKYKNIFFRPIEPKIVLLGADSILRVKTMVD